MMSTMQAILIKCILGLDDAHLRQMFIVADVFMGGLTDRDALDPVSAGILVHLQSMTENERIMTLKYIHALKDFQEVSS